MHNSNHWANRIADKIVHVDENAPEVLRNQASMFKDHIVEISKEVIVAAVESEILCLAQDMEEAGHKEIAEEIRKSQYVKL